MTDREKRLAPRMASGVDMADEVGLLRLRILRLAETSDPADEKAMAKCRLMVWMLEVLARMATLQARVSRPEVDVGEAMAEVWEEMAADRG